MQQQMYLPTPGPLPGFPGASHGPGEVILDYDARTVTPISDAVSEEQPAEEQAQPADIQPTQDVSTPGVPG